MKRLRGGGIEIHAIRKRSIQENRKECERGCTLSRVESILNSWSRERS